MSSDLGGTTVPRPSAPPGAGDARQSAAQLSRLAQELVSRFRCR